jgi:hypothetical protein
MSIKEKYEEVALFTKYKKIVKTVKRYSDLRSELAELLVDLKKINAYNINVDEAEKAFIVDATTMIAASETSANKEKIAAHFDKIPWAFH